MNLKRLHNTGNVLPSWKRCGQHISQIFTRLLQLLTIYQASTINRLQTLYNSSLLRYLPYCNCLTLDVIVCLHFQVICMSLIWSIQFQMYVGNLFEPPIILISSDWMWLIKENNVGSKLIAYRYLIVWHTSIHLWFSLSLKINIWICFDYFSHQDINYKGFNSKLRLVRYLVQI